MLNSLIKNHLKYFRIAIFTFELAVIACCFFRLTACNCLLPMIEEDSPWWYIYNNIFINNIFAYISIALGLFIIFLSSRNFKAYYLSIYIALLLQMFLFFYAKEINIDYSTLLPRPYDFIGFILEIILLLIIQYLGALKRENTKTVFAYDLIICLIILVINFGIFQVFNL
ncbi:MAG: hypothetical protein ACOX0I_00230 [Bacilli bacterium]|jgi:hypothetical protein